MWKSTALPRAMLGPGDTFERYAIDALIGQGGMGCVYRARDTRLERRVALKVIADAAAENPEANTRLIREARAAAALDHPNAVSIFDVGVHEGRPYVVMELVPGRTLREIVGEKDLPLRVKLGWLLDAARALAAAHRRGLVHRDVKPENVMVRDDGVVKVLDFGIARRVRDADADPHAATQNKPLTTLTAQGVHVGTPQYMAPEQIRGDALDGRADQFAWGLLAYELCAGQHPWHQKQDALGMLAAVLTDEAPVALLESAGVPEPVRGVILRAVAKRPDERFGSMDDVVRALEPLVLGGTSSAPPPEPKRATPDVPASTVASAAPAGPPSPTLARRYSTDEMREVLLRALDRQNEQPEGRFRFDELVAAAAEVGVDAQTLREATREIRERREPVAAPRSEESIPFEVWARDRRRGFLRHALIYLLVSFFLAVLNHKLGDVIPFFATYRVWLLPALGWGLGVAIHGVVAMLPDRERWRAEQEWWRVRRERRRARDERRRQFDATVDKAIDEGVSLLLDAGSKLRDHLGVGAGEGAPRRDEARVRVAVTEPAGAARAGESVEREPAAPAAKRKAR